MRKKFAIFIAKYFYGRQIGDIVDHTNQFGHSRSFQIIDFECRLFQKHYNIHFANIFDIGVSVVGFCSFCSSDVEHFGINAFK